MNLGFKDADPAHTSFQFLEELSTAYWYSQVLFSSLELNLFQFLDQGLSSLESLAKESHCGEQELARLLSAMEAIGLITSSGENYYNSQVSSLFLVPGKRDYMGDFFLYRQFMRPQWEKLTQKVSPQKENLSTDLSYEERNLGYVASTDTLVRQKIKELIPLLKPEKIKGPILDIGGGAGSLIRAIQKLKPDTAAILFDLPEVIEAAHNLYPEKNDWEGITTITGDFRTHAFDPEDKFSLISMSNFLHAYGPKEARQLLLKACDLLSSTGLLVIHDYFPDRKGAVPQKGPLYDLAMMLNTFNGVCHDTKTITRWLKEANIETIGINDLNTDTTLIMARKNGPLHLKTNPWTDLAMEIGFDDITPITPEDVVTAPWVNAKCRCGCKEFGKNLQCPPKSLEYTKTRQLLDSYKTAFLVKGAPPGKQFHDALLTLEKNAFLQGFHKAFVFGAGPCPVCPQCPSDGTCRHHNLARPSMEGSGIDVYTSVKNGGWSLSPVKEKGHYVTYIGLFLVE
jgi:predicted metal-binding protein